MREPRDFAAFYAATFPSLCAQLSVHTGDTAEAQDVVAGGLLPRPAPLGQATRIRRPRGLGTQGGLEPRHQPVAPDPPPHGRDPPSWSTESDAQGNLHLIDSQIAELTLANPSAVLTLPAVTCGRYSLLIEGAFPPPTFVRATQTETYFVPPTSGQDPSWFLRNGDGYPCPPAETSPSPTT